MSNYNSDPIDDFELEITSLDASEDTSKKAPVVVQDRRFSARARLWLAISSVIMSVLLIFLVLSTILPVLIAKHSNIAPAPFPAASVIDTLLVADGVTYVNTHNGIVHALRVSDGMQIWEYKTIDPKVAPVFINGVLYLQSQVDQSSEVHALRAKDGRLLWRFVGPSLDFNPLIIDNGVAYPLFNSRPQGRVLSALNAHDGSLRWQYVVDTAVASGVQIQSVQDKIYINPLPGENAHDAALYVLRSTDGVLLWHYNYDSLLNDNYTGPPVVQRDLVYITEGGGAIKVLHSGNGSEAWHYKSTGTNLMVPIVQGNIVYTSAGDNTLEALSALDGALLWTLQGNQAMASFPEEADGIVYFVTADGYVNAIRTSDGKQIWQVQAAPTLPPEFLVIADGIVYVVARENNEDQRMTLYALRIKDGSLLWRYNTNQSTVGSGLVRMPENGVVYVMAGTNVMQVLRDSNGTVLWHVDFSSISTFSLFDVANGIAFLRLSNNVLEARRVQDGFVLWRYPHTL